MSNLTPSRFCKCGQPLTVLHPESIYTACDRCHKVYQKHPLLEIDEGQHFFSFPSRLERGGEVFIIDRARTSVGKMNISGKGDNFVMHQLNHRIHRFEGVLERWEEAYYLKESTETISSNALARLEPGDEVLMHSKRAMEVEWMDRAAYTWLEGEWMLPNMIGQKFFLIFLRSMATGDRLLLIVSNDLSIRVLDASPIGLETKPIAPLSCSCPNCSANLTAYNGGLSKIMGCVSCLCTYRTHGMHWEKIGDAPKMGLAFQLGSKLSLYGTEYIVIGASERSSEDALHQWYEYVLHHPDKPFTSLSEYRGHFHFLQQTDEYIVESDHNIQHDGLTFRPYTHSYNTIVGALGEIPCDVWSKAHYHEYISPPFMLSVERNEFTRDCFKGRYVPVREIERAAHDNIDLYSPIGVGAAQPVGTFLPQHQLIRLCVAYALLLLVYLIFAQWTSNAPVYGLARAERTAPATESNYNISLDSATRASMPAPPPVDDAAYYYTFENIELKGSYNLMCLEATTELSNNWTYLEATLINKATGESFQVSGDMEYYQGVDEGEPWSEGSRSRDYYFSHVPGGTYTLILHCTSNASTNSGDVRFELKTKNMTFGTWFLFLLIGLLLPVGIMIWAHKREQQRWYNSDYYTPEYE